MEIREYANGKFQVWNGDQVLRPEKLEWENDYQSYHDFMFFPSLRAARKAAKEAMKKHSEREDVVRIHAL